LSKSHKETNEKRPFFERFSFVLLTVLAFIIIYSLIFFAFKETLAKAESAANAAIPVVKTGLMMPNDSDAIFLKYGGLFGIALGAIVFSLLLILYGIARVTTLTKLKSGPAIVLITAYGFFFLIGLKLAFFEKAYIPWATAVIYFVGRPLFFSTLIMLAISVGLLCHSLTRKIHGEAKKTKTEAADS
jgi:hypothetical protein